MSWKCSSAQMPRRHRCSNAESSAKSVSSHVLACDPWIPRRPRRCFCSYCLHFLSKGACENYSYEDCSSAAIFVCQGLKKGFAQVVCKAASTAQRIQSHTTALVFSFYSHQEEKVLVFRWQPADF